MGDKGRCLHRIGLEAPVRQMLPLNGSFRRPARPQQQRIVYLVVYVVKEKRVASEISLHF